MQNVLNHKLQLYQIPLCSICIEDLNHSILSLHCGHCFHEQCIGHSLSYRSTCPVCKAPAFNGQLRKIHFDSIPKENRVLLEFLQSLEGQSKQQVESLLKEIMLCKQRQDKLKSELLELRGIKEAADNLREESERRGRENKHLERENRQLERLLDRTKAQIEQYKNLQTKRREQIDKYRRLQKRYEEIKQFEKIMNEKGRKIAQYKLQLESKATPPQQMARIFYDMVLLKHFEWKKIKDNTSLSDNIISNKEKQIMDLKVRLSSLADQLKKKNDKMTQERQRYCDLRQKYKALSEKLKGKGLGETSSLEDSQFFSNTFKTSQKIEKIERIEDEKGFKKPKRKGLAIGWKSIFSDLQKKEGKKH